MRRHKQLAALVALGAATLAGGVAAADRAPQRRPRSAPTGLAPAAPSRAAALAESEIRDRDIAFYEARAAADPESAGDRSQLAVLYLRRGRATGDFADYARAERVARRSLALRTGHNAQTFGLLASALLARHAFAEALAVARTADSLDPGVPAHVALLAEIELETGDYDAARRHFSSIAFNGEDFTLAARLARWHELTGHVDVARQLLRLAASKAGERDDLPREEVSWFYYRLGDLDARRGDLEAAEASFRRGLTIFPEDYRILSGLARLAAARQRWADAIDYGNQAIAIQLEPGTLGTISEAYAALGDTALAAQYARAMTGSALVQPGPIHRAWGLFLLDHGTARDAGRVLARCRAEMRMRRDVYGYDLLAWALYKQGRPADARVAMRHALAQHTEDAQLFYHAGMIERALGDTAAARNYLQRALATNPYFGGTQPAIARAALNALGGPGRV